MITQRVKNSVHREGKHSRARTLELEADVDSYSSCHVCRQEDDVVNATPSLTTTSKVNQNNLQSERLKDRYWASQ